jgi:hypothetical protein
MLLQIKLSRRRAPGLRPSGLWRSAVAWTRKDVSENRAYSLDCTFPLEIFVPTQQPTRRHILADRILKINMFLVIILW